MWYYIVIWGHLYATIHIRLQPQTANIIAEEQAGFRAGSSTTQQECNPRILCKKYLQLEQNPNHTGIYIHWFQQRLWQGMVWRDMGNYEEIGLECRHHKSRWNSIWQGPECSPDQWQHKKSVRNFSRGMKRVFLLSPTFLNIFIKRIVCEELVDHDGNVRFGGRLITNFRFADDMIL